MDLVVKEYHDTYKEHLYFELAANLRHTDALDHSRE